MAKMKSMLFGDYSHLELTPENQVLSRPRGIHDGPVKVLTREQIDGLIADGKITPMEQIRDCYMPGEQWQ